MSLTAYQINNGMPTPIADRKMYNLTTGGVTGVFEGCTCSKYAASVIVSDGWIIIQGCIIRVKRETVPITLSSSGTLNGRLSIKLDVSEPSVEWYSEAATTLPTIGSSSYPQEDINGSGSVYILPLCTYQVDGVQISSTEVTYIAPQVSVEGMASIESRVAALESRTINGKSLSSDITLSASDVSAVPTTRKVNNKALSSDITLAASDVSAVPTTRTVNGKALSSNITIGRSDIIGIVLNGASSSANKTLNMSLSGTTLTITWS